MIAVALFNDGAIFEKGFKTNTFRALNSMHESGLGTRLGQVHVMYPYLIVSLLVITYPYHCAASTCLQKPFDCMLGDDNCNSILHKLCTMYA